MRLVIIESPYAGDIDNNTLYARRCVRDAVLRGDAPIASHLLFTQPGILDDSVLEERALGIEAGLAWRAVADISIFYTDLGWSNGMLSALHDNIMFGYPIEIRALDSKPRIPNSDDADIEALLLRACVSP